MGQAQYADLHTHTTASDGSCSPQEVVRMAKDAGLSAVAVTDHDTVSGIAEAVQAGRSIGIEVIPGVEISTVEQGKDIHILGYDPDTSDREFLEALRRLRNTRNLRNEMILARLGELGMPITMQELLDHMAKKKQEDQTVGRPHIAELLVARGYVPSVQEAFDRYLASGAAAYVNPPRIRPSEAVRIIRAAGGKAVLAHPGLYGDDRIVHDLIQSGLDGIEAYHSDHTEQQERAYAELAARHGLIATAGSDFHGRRDGRAYHGEIGSKRVRLDLLARLKRI